MCFPCHQHCSDVEGARGSLDVFYSMPVCNVLCPPTAPNLVYCCAYNEGISVLDCNASTTKEVLPWSLSQLSVSSSLAMLGVPLDRVWVLQSQ